MPGDVTPSLVNVIKRRGSAWVVRLVQTHNTDAA